MSETDWFKSEVSSCLLLAFASLEYMNTHTVEEQRQGGRKSTVINVHSHKKRKQQTRAPVCTDCCVPYVALMWHLE